MPLTVPEPGPPLGPERREGWASPALPVWKYQSQERSRLCIVVAGWLVVLSNYRSRTKSIENRTNRKLQRKAIDFMGFFLSVSPNATPLPVNCFSHN